MLSALAEDVNVIGVGASVALSLALLNPLPLLIGGVIEAAYLLFVPDSEPYQRRLEHKATALLEGPTATDRAGRQLGDCNAPLRLEDFLKLKAQRGSTIVTSGRSVDRGPEPKPAATPKSPVNSAAKSNPAVRPTAPKVVPTAGAKPLPIPGVQIAYRAGLPDQAPHDATSDRDEVASGLVAIDDELQIPVVAPFLVEGRRASQNRESGASQHR